MPKVYKVVAAIAISVHVKAEQGSELYSDLWFDENDANWWNLEHDKSDDQSGEWIIGPLGVTWNHNARTLLQRDLHKPFQSVTFDPGLNNEFWFDLDARVGSLSGGSQVSVVEVTVTQNGKVVKSEDGNPYVVVGKGTTAKQWETLIFKI